MNQNEVLITKFYTNFQQKSAAGMIECYHDDIHFSDPAFQNLKGIEAKAMWQMLIERSSTLKITFSNVKATENEGSADWIAEYIFSKTNRQVVNKIHAEFKFKDGKIIDHKDNFNLWKWAGMALGITGYLLGFTPNVKNKIREDAMSGLKLFMKRKRMK
jgi:ketosteroid isomerase-like protein